MFPRALAPGILLAALGLLLLYFSLTSSPWSLKAHLSSPPLPPPPPFLPAPASQESPERTPRVLNNPYTSWWLAWHQEKRTHTLVVAKLAAESVSWIDTELDELVGIKKAIYVVDDQTARLHTPANKGNEAMVYLSYIIDFYDKLPDVSTFMHSHAGAWHNSDLMNSSSSTMLRRLSLEKVVREGYMNLRCELHPGCPISAQLDRIDDGDPDSKMNEKVVDFLLELFPEQKLPPILAQPCCAQFSLSRDTILRHSKSQYIALRDWILKTDSPKVITGRVFEYVWHYLFTSKPVFCPSEQICYCDAYAICFPTKAVWLEYQDILKTKHALLEEHRSLSQSEESTKRRAELSMVIDGLHDAAERRKEEAFSIGSNGIVRQQVLYDAWEDLKYHGQL